MIGWFILGICLLTGLLLAGRWFAVADPRQLARGLRFVAIGIGLIGVVYVLVSGRIALASLLIGGLLPLFMRWRALGRMFRNARGPSPGQESGVSTRFLRMSLDHDTGVMTGTVLEGRYRGRTLDALSLSELLDLLDQCQIDDPQSVSLLETWLDRTQGEDWRSRRGREAGPDTGGGPMTAEEAYRVLGLEPGADEAEIKRAHRDLMQKLHPDRGGSTWLAAKINEAKEFLLRT